MYLNTCIFIGKIMYNIYKNAMIQFNSTTFVNLWDPACARQVRNAALRRSLFGVVRTAASHSIDVRRRLKLYLALNRIVELS